MQTVTRCLLLFSWLLVSVPLQAQQEKRWIKYQINSLAGNAMHGRGYVSKGVEKAAGYLARKYRELGLLPFDADSSYLQHFYFPVNTFPNRMQLKLQKKQLRPGVDYLIHEGSTGINRERVHIRPLDLREVKDSTAWEELKQRLDPNMGYFVKNADTLVKYFELNRKSFIHAFPAGLYLVPKHGKLTWSVATYSAKATVFYLEDTVLPRRIRKAAAVADAKYISDFRSSNVVGYVPGTRQPDSFVVFTAHFDHLGHMGRHAIFPGAHDNASGTALMLYLASYFARNPQPYTIVFIGFSGEEAGLLGSTYFTEHPLFPLESIRFLVNLDMTGDATDGITVVNATEQQQAFSLLNQINEKKSYLPKILERGQAANSDHYPFCENGVPAIFIYGLGAKGYYHDIFDKPQELSLNNIDNLAKLLIEFATAIQPRN